MASRLWNYWGSAPEPKFPEPPRNPLAYTPHDSSGPTSRAILDDSDAPLILGGAVVPPSNTDKDQFNDKNGLEMEESTVLEEIAISAAPVSIFHEDKPDLRLAVKRFFGKEHVKKAIGRWREALTWLPLDVPSELDLSPINIRYIPYYAFYADLDCYCSGTYEVEMGNGKEKTSTEFLHRDQLNEILVCASSDIEPNLMDEFFEAKAFHPPATPILAGSYASQQTIPIIPRHPFHMIRYRDHLLQPSTVEDATLLDPDINETLAINMIRDYLIHDAGPFIGEQAFKTRFGIDAKDVRVATIVKDMKCYLLFLPIYTTTYSYHEKTYKILVSGVNGHVAGQRMTWGTGQIGRAFTSVSSSISKIVSSNI